MKTRIALIAALSLAVRAFALDITTTDGASFHDVKITAVEADAIRFMHAEGTGRIVYEKLPASVRAKYFDAAKIAALRKEQAAAIETQRAKAAADAKVAEERAEAEKAESARMEREQAAAAQAANAERQRAAIENAATARAEKAAADLETRKAALGAHAEKQRLAAQQAEAGNAEKHAAAVKRTGTIIGLLILCFLPTLIALFRGRANFLPIFVLNVVPSAFLVAWSLWKGPNLLLLFFWKAVLTTIGICWLVSLVWAVSREAGKVARRTAAVAARVK